MVYGNVWTMAFKYYQYAKEEQPFREPRELSNGVVYGLSNGHINQWDKVLRGKATFARILNCKAHEMQKNNDRKLPARLQMNRVTQDLQQMMKDDTRSKWCRVQGGTGKTKYWEWLNSSLFSRNNIYNFSTLSTTSLVIHRSGQAMF